MTEPVEKIAAAVLYEGYVLWPYRRSAQKNQKRWTFGGVYPRAFSETAGTNDPWLMQTQCLVVGEKPAVEVKVRFLQVVERQVGRYTGDGTVGGGFQTRPYQGVEKAQNLAGRLEFVDEIRVGNERYLAWEEAAEREVVASGLGLAELRDADARGDLDPRWRRRGAAGRSGWRGSRGRWFGAGAPWKVWWR